MVHRDSESGAPDSNGREFTFGSLRLDADGTLTRGNELIHLPPKELAALEVLLTNASRIVTHQQLKQALWGDVHVGDGSVPKCMSSLRELLAPDDCIQTIYKRGYRLAAGVSKLEPEPSEGLPRVVIMPFAVDVNVPAYLGPAIAEETISLLTADPLSPARVLARDSAFSLAARGLTAHQAGEALQADLVLTGTLRSLPAHFRLRTEMIRVADGIQIWVEDMLVPQDRTAALESELAHRLFVRLSASDWFSQNAIESARNPGNREAYDLYLRGHHESQTPQRHRMLEGVQHLARAVALDPSLYSAHIDLAHASILQAFCGFASPADAAERVRHAAESIPSSTDRADAILPALGWIRFSFDHDLPGALRVFNASAHLPRETVTTRLRSMFALSRHRFHEAIEILTEAWRADPYSPWLSARLAWAYHLGGEREKSVAQAERALELFPDFESAGIYGSLILAFNCHPERAIAIAENLVRRSPYFDLCTAVHAYALACGGQRTEARSILERLQWLSRERFVPSSFTPAVAVVLGDEEGAIRGLKAAAEAHCPWFFQMLADPRLNALSDHPEFIRMRKTLERMEASATAKRVNHHRAAADSNSSAANPSGITP
jgi:DNA-binding winged helix-turn-helix (wHTH) protein/tetratricopeptide (TPR) repeat protein